MDNNVEKYRYLITLFVYAMREYIPRVNTVFRLIYIYKVSVDYLNGNTHSISDDKIFIDQTHIGVGDFNQMNTALGIAISSGYINEEQGVLSPGDILENFVIERSAESIDIMKDVQRITYFTDVVLSYGEDVVLAVFYKEPNYASAALRNRSEISLANNELLSILIEFEHMANKKSSEELEKYDVFISWLNFVLDEYLKEKST